MASSSGSDRRRANRQKLLRAGVIFYGDRGQSMACAVLDMSKDSAKLKPEKHGVLPNSFQLRLHAHETFECKVVRRSGYLLAVKLSPAKEG
jgi:hypothetical protein